MKWPHPNPNLGAMIILQSVNQIFGTGQETWWRKTKICTTVFLSPFSGMKEIMRRLAQSLKTLEEGENLVEWVQPFAKGTLFLFA